MIHFTHPWSILRLFSSSSAEVLVISSVTAYLVAVPANCDTLGLLLRLSFDCIAEQALQHVAVYKLYVCTPCQCTILGGSYRYSSYCTSPYDHTLYEMPPQSACLLSKAGTSMCLPCRQTAVTFTLAVHVSQSLHTLFPALFQTVWAFPTGPTVSRGKTVNGITNARNDGMHGDKLILSPYARLTPHICGTLTYIPNRRRILAF